MDDPRLAIQAILDEAVAGAKSVSFNNLKPFGNVEFMMRLGLFPTMNFNQSVIDRLTMDEATYKFWYPDSNHPEGQKYENNLKWYYSTLDEHKRNGIHMAVSLPLMYLAPHLVYNGSKRPKTEMDIFRSPLSNVVNRNEIIDGKVNILGEVWNCIPVTRYGAGMSRGMYYGEEEKNGDIEEEYCGTFYYYEPESTTFLAYMTSRTYFNKSSAVIKLGEEFGKDYYIGDIDEDVLMHTRGDLPADLMMTPLQYSKYMADRVGKDNYYTETVMPENMMMTSMEYSQYLSNLYSRDKAEKLSQIPHYIANKVDLYAAEDKYDQVLCEAARDNGIQIVTLTNVVGSTKTVTEILDTRDRKESFKSLVYTI